MHNFEDKLKTYAKIDLGALERNYLAIKARIEENTPDCELMCVVKADAYGHGTERCVKRLSALGASCFGVSCIEEARDVKRYANPDSKILILGYTPVENAEELASEGFIQTVYSLEYGRALSESAARCKKTVRVHLKLDTGMNRLGFYAEDSNTCIRDVREAMALPYLHTEGIFTHFACADSEESDATERQHASFMRIVEMLGDAAKGLCVHCCNSAAALRYPQFRHSMVRAGIILYGLSPDRGYTLPVKLEPVMTFMTTVMHVHTLRKGESVSYGGRFTAERDMRIATLGVGYADGFLRAFSQGGEVLINCKPAPVVGRVCMDQCMVDIGDNDVKIGDRAVIFDSMGENIERLAEFADTICYELICLV
ncbi:MAG: alanine racemase, partial [Clostridia bacterium]|nr:alanine racemase [Clostridia bacterium]